MLAQLRQTTMMVSSNTALSFSAMKEHDMCTRNSWNNRSAIRKKKRVPTHLTYDIENQNDVAFRKHKATHCTLGQPSHLTSADAHLSAPWTRWNISDKYITSQFTCLFTSTATMRQQISHVHFRKNTWLQFSVTREPLASFNDRSGQHTELRLSTRLRFG